MIGTDSSASAVARSATEAPPREERKGRVTLKDVAKVAGVHFTTVSLALRNHPSIPPTTRDYIRAAADRLGYTPNPVFSALTHFHLHGRVRATPPQIAYVVNQSLESGAVRYRHQEVILQGARAQAQILGYELRFISIDAGLNDTYSVRKILDDNHIRGLILASFEPGEAELDLPWDQFAVVKVNSLHMTPDAPVVANDQRQDVRMAFHELLNKGYRRIGLAVGKADEEATQYRYSAGYLMQQFAIPPEDRVPALLFPHRSTAEEVADLLREWISTHRVEAVLCNWAIIDELVRNAGYQVPQQVAAVCLCLLERNQKLAGVCPNLQKVGANAVSTLTTLLKSGELGLPQFASRTYVRSFWQEGATAPSRR